MIYNKHESSAAGECGEVSVKEDSSRSFSGSIVAVMGVTLNAKKELEVIPLLPLWLGEGFGSAGVQYATMSCTSSTSYPIYLTISHSTYVNSPIKLLLVSS